MSTIVEVGEGRNAAMKASYMRRRARNANQVVKRRRRCPLLV
jgi:hypothetical protein